MNTVASHERTLENALSDQLRVAMIGYGAIGQSIARRLTGELDGKVELSHVLVRNLRSDGCDHNLTTSLNDLINSEPDLVIECAGHEALHQYGSVILGSGTDLMIISSGALTDASLEQKLLSSARDSGAHIEIPAGAIGGVDAICAARRAGLSSIQHTSIKPTRAWMGTPAEQQTNLNALREKFVVFDGTAREAATMYPENANVSATISFAGLGLDRTHVRLVADPDALVTTHIIEAEGEFGSLRQITTSSALDGNPKSSSFTAYSAVNSILRRLETIRI